MQKGGAWTGERAQETTSKNSWVRANEMAQQIKAPATKPGDPKFDSRILRGRRRELMPTGCSLTSTRMWVWYAYPRMH